MEETNVEISEAKYASLIETLQKPEFKGQLSQPDMKIYFNPDHPKFSKFYTLEDEQSEALLKACQIKLINRNMWITVGFVSYAGVKALLWNYGYFAHFFSRTRYA